MELSIGQIVISKAGRDVGKKFVVIDMNNEFVFLVNGKERKISRPKKKKIKHIEMTKEFSDIVNNIKNSEILTDNKIRKSLRNFRN